jgi:hypothetical protein
MSCPLRAAIVRQSVILLASATLLSHPARATTNWDIGDIFLGVASGTYQVRDQAGALKESLVTGRGGFTTGCSFDQSGNLYVTEFSANNVSSFLGPMPPHTNSLFGSGYSTPESIVFDAAGNVYVGNLGNGIRQYAPDGTFIKTVINTRVDFFDIAADQDTILYTQEGNSILTTSISSGGSGSFSSGTATQAFAIRILADGGALLADLNNVKRYNAAGAVVDTYDVSGENSWFSLNLDPDGTSFWAGNFSSASYYKFDIATGGGVDNHLAQFNTGTGTQTLFGICLFGEITAAIPRDITLDPEIALNPVGTTHTVIATVTEDSAPLEGAEVTFEVASGPNAADSGSDTTDAAGEAEFTYTGDGGKGVDEIEASFVDSDDNVNASSPVLKFWDDDCQPNDVPDTCDIDCAGFGGECAIFDGSTLQDGTVLGVCGASLDEDGNQLPDECNTPPVASCVESVNPSGKKTPPAGSTTLPGAKGGQNEDGFYELIGEDEQDGTADLFVTNASGSVTFGPFASGSVVKITEDPEETPTSKKMGEPNSAVAAHIVLDSDAFVFAIDSFGAISEEAVSCLVPAPPK